MTLIKPFLLAAVAVGITTSLLAQPDRLNLPARPANSEGGQQFAGEISGLAPEGREARIYREIMSGNIPNFERKLVPVATAAHIQGKLVNARFFVIPDYLAVGSDADYLYVPLTPFTAQKIADRLRCLLPTPPMVDAIYAAADVKLEPLPLPPSPTMTTVSAFSRHTATILPQRSITLAQFPLGTLTAGDKKDVVICKGLATHPRNVAIYGWQKPDGIPIQPLYLGHLASWADYSQGIRLVSQTIEVEGKPMSLPKLLQDPKHCALVSAEGPLTIVRYQLKKFPIAPKSRPSTAPVSP